MKSSGGYVKRRMPAGREDFTREQKRASAGGQIYSAFLGAKLHDAIVSAVRTNPPPKKSLRMLFGERTIMQANATDQKSPTFFRRRDACRGSALRIWKFLSASSRTASGNWR